MVNIEAEQPHEPAKPVELWNGRAILVTQEIVAARDDGRDVTAAEPAPIVTDDLLAARDKGRQ